MKNEHLKFDREWLRKKIASDPDVDTDAGVLHHEAPQKRFFIEHGMIHDRKTGKHITTDEDTWATPEGVTMPNPHGSGITSTCDLLNELSAQHQASEPAYSAADMAENFLAGMNTVRMQNVDLLEALKGILGALDQPVTRRLRKENSIFNGDMCVIEHFAREAIAKATQP